MSNTRLGLRRRGLYSGLVSVMPLSGPLKLLFASTVSSTKWNLGTKKA